MNLLEKEMVTHSNILSWEIPWTDALKGLMLKLKEAPIFYLMGRNDSVEKAPDAGKDWRQEEKGMTEDEMVEWHHWLNGYEFE